MTTKPERRVRLARRGKRFVFLYKVQAGDTASEIAEDLLGHVENVELLKHLNPNVETMSDITADTDLIVTVATPGQVNTFMEAAFETVSHGTSDGNMLSLSSFQEIMRKILDEQYEGQLP